MSEDNKLSAIMPKVVTDVRPLMARLFVAGLSMADVAEVFGVKLYVVENLVRYYAKPNRE